MPRYVRGYKKEKERRKEREREGARRREKIRRKIYRTVVPPYLRIASFPRLTVDNHLAALILPFNSALMRANSNPPERISSPPLFSINFRRDCARARACRRFHKTRDLRKSPALWLRSSRTNFCRAFIGTSHRKRAASRARSRELAGSRPAV